MLYQRAAPVEPKRKRKTKPAAEQKSRQFNVRMTHEFYAEFSGMAERMGITRSNLVRKLFVEEKVRQIDAQ